MFGLPFGQFGVTFVVLILAGFDSFGVNFESKLQAFLSLDCISIEMLMTILLEAEVLKDEGIAVEFRLDIIAKTVLLCYLGLHLANLLLDVLHLLEQSGKSLAQ